MQSATRTPVFTLLRQKPKFRPEEMQDLGPITYADFLEVFGTIDWATEVREVKWARKGLPMLAVKNTLVGSILWVVAATAETFVDVDSEPDERFRVDRFEPWYRLGMQPPLGISNVVLLDPHDIGDEFSFVAFAPEAVHEAFELFFREDLAGLYGMFR